MTDSLRDSNSKPSFATPDRSPAAGVSALLQTVAVVLLGQVMVWGAREFSWAAMACATAAILAAGASLWLRSPGTGTAHSGAGAIDIGCRWVTLAGIALGFYQLPLVRLYWQLPQLRPTLVPFVAMALLAAGLASVTLLLPRRRFSAACFLLLLAVQALMGLWYLRLSTDPRIDVYLIQRLGCEALTRGHNPFAITFPDIYGPAAHYYPPGTVVNGQVQCGYFYPPLSLVSDLPGFLLGDLRLSHWAALTITYGLMSFGMTRRRGTCRDFGPVILLMFLPGIFPLMENAWIEPVLLLMLTLCVVTALRGRWVLSAAALGLLLAGKQYALMATPAAWLLLPRPRPQAYLFRRAAVAAAAGLAVTLPFLLWNPHVFFHSLISIYVGILRPDSISYLPILSRLLGHRLSLGATVGFAMPATVLVLWRAPRTPAGFAAGAALILLCAFAFSTQAFSNYYFLAAGALCVSLTARGSVNADLLSPVSVRRTAETVSAPVG